MTTIDTSRQDDLISQEKMGALRIAIIGCGAIGSNAAHMLISMGATQITIYDFDSLELPNLAPGFFSLDGVGLAKVDAVANDIKSRFGLSIETANMKLDYDTQIDTDYDVVIIGLDSMEARQFAWFAFEGKWQLWIDAAMGGVRAMIDVLRHDQDPKAYHQKLGRPDTVLQCGEKAFPPNCKGLLPWAIGTIVWRHINGLEPFSMYFDSDHGYLGIAAKSGYGTFKYAMSAEYDKSDSLE